MSLAIPQDGFNITEDEFSLPEEFLEGECKHVFIELLNPLYRLNTNSETLRKNHAIFKIDFKEQVAGYDGVRLSMHSIENQQDIYEDGKLYVKGKLCVKPVSYCGSSMNAACSGRLRFKEGLTLEKLLYTLIYTEMDDFAFLNVDDKLYGCRDFIAQALSVLEAEKRVESKFEAGSKFEGDSTENLSTADLTGYDILGMWFGQGRNMRCAIEKGKFSDKYRRVNLDKIAYSPI